MRKAQQLWSDPKLLELSGRVTDELRWIVVGRLAGKTWSAVITRRDECIRLISVRRARKGESDLYESQDI